ncbi:MAG: peptidyl-prolyl cis-trans isomerase [Thermoleophilaceae bacterium]|jgi:foldase protein PrsA|nr:peptidyl-prolyl cis-trans isomerase [Thermoleophilaceae bacterium]
MLNDKNLRPRAALRSRPRLLLVGAAVLAAAALAGCGNSVPSDGVANVDGEVIDKQEFEHWLGAAARSQQAQPGAAPMPVALPDPPEFRKCAAAKIAAPPQPGAPKPNEQQGRELCKQEYGLLRDQVMQFLVSSLWIEAEASDRDLEAADGEVDKMFNDQKRQSFPSDQEYQQFLKASGQTEEDLRYRVKLDVLSNKVREAIVKGKADVSEAEVRSFYSKNKGQFGQPERRDLSVVLTEKEADAKKARKALDGGAEFKDVAKKYSIDEASKGQGGKLTGVGKGQQEMALDDAVFTAKQGELTGPVKTQFGFYVFEVDKVAPGSQQSFEQSRETIRAQLRSTKEQKALTAFVEGFQKEFKEKTNCAKGFTIPQCKNGGKLPSPNDPAAQGAPQQGVPQQGAPQQGAPQQGGQGAPPTQGAPPSGG